MGRDKYAFTEGTASDLLKNLEDSHSAHHKQISEYPRLRGRERVEVYLARTSTVVGAWIHEGTVGTGTGTGTGTRPHGTGVFGSGTAEIFGAFLQGSGNYTPLDLKYTETIYNIGQQAIPSNTWVILDREPHSGILMVVASALEQVGESQDFQFNEEDVFCGPDGYLKKSVVSATLHFVLGVYAGNTIGPAVVTDLGCVPCGNCPGTGTGTGGCTLCVNKHQQPPATVCFVLASNPSDPLGKRAYSNTCNIQLSWSAAACRYFGTSVGTIGQSTVIWNWEVGHLTSDGFIDITGTNNFNSTINLTGTSSQVRWNCSSPLTFTATGTVPGAPTAVIGTLQTGTCPATSCSGTGSGTGQSCNPVRVSMGNGSTSGTSSVTVTISFAHAVPAGALVILECAGATTGLSLSNTTATFTPTGGSPANMTLDSIEPNGFSSGAINAAKTWKFHYKVPSTCTGATITANVVNPDGLSLIEFAAAEYVTGLVNGAFDKPAFNRGFGSTPDTGPTSPTGFACEYAEAVFLYVGSTGPTWANGFISGGQDILGALSGVNLVFTEGYKHVSPSGQQPDARLSAPASPAAWSGDLNTYD